jgi:uncharacterized protein (TIGR00299 family) protein
MARVMYIECFSGVAGDMLLGALVDAGLPIEALRTAMGSMGVDHEISTSRVVRSGIAATRIEVVPVSDGHGGHEFEQGATHRHEAGHGHAHGTGREAHRSLADISHFISHSALSDTGKARAISLFRRLGEAEAAIHHVPVDTIHFHEVGAVDSIVDVCGVVFALEWLGVDDIVASPINVGGGQVKIAHGTFPVPAPATALLLKGVPIYSAGPQVELTTPTGALLVSDYAREFGPAPAMTVDRIGYGAGTRDFASVPNVVRVLIGERAQSVAAPIKLETIVKLECEIDDMNPQWFSPAADRLFDAGALDVFFTPVVMKKGRPGTLVTVLAAERQRQAMVDILFRDTTTIGVRVETVTRETLDRRWVDVSVEGGTVRIKVAERAGAILNAAPEFEDCVRIAESTGRPLKDVQADALAAWHALKPRVS